MKKKKFTKGNVCLFFAALSFFCIVVFAILALCFCAKDFAIGNFPLWAVFAGACGFAVVCYGVSLACSAPLKLFKRNLELSLEIPIVATLLIALSPLAVVLWVVEQIFDAIKEGKSAKNK